jgi:leucine efflux protein
MLGTVNLPEYTLGALLIVLLPGPNSLYVLSVAARGGVRRGYRAATGVFLGDTTLITFTALGAATALTRSPALFDVVKYLGAAYLAFLGFTMLKAAARSFRARVAHAAHAAQAAHTAHAPGGATGEVPGAQPGADEAVDGAAVEVVEAAAGSREGAAAERPFRRALIISLLNPKAILFFLAFFSQFVDPHAAHPAAAFALLGVIVQAFSFTYLTSLIFGGSRLAAAFRRRRRLTATLTGGVGSLFLGFAAKLATATLR